MSDPGQKAPAYLHPNLCFGLAPWLPVGPFPGVLSLSPCYAPPPHALGSVSHPGLTMPRPPPLVPPASMPPSFCHFPRIIVFRGHSEAPNQSLPCLSRPMICPFRMGSFPPGWARGSCSSAEGCAPCQGSHAIGYTHRTPALLPGTLAGHTDLRWSAP